MEHIVHYIAKHLSDNGILLESHHGLCGKLSTATQLVSSCHDWVKPFLSQVDVVFLDFSKALIKLPIISFLLSCVTAVLRL